MSGLTALERETLSAWSHCEVGYGFGFKVAAQNCQTPLENIRRVVRALARKGQLEYVRSLYTEEGEMGAGYALTQEGAASIATLEQSAAS